MADDQGSSGQQLPLRPRPARSKMSSPTRQRSPQKSTPRRSTSQPPRNNNAAAGQQTPDVSRASAPPSSTTRFSIRTPGNQVLDFRSSRQLLSASGRKGAGSAVPTQFTPHGRAAIRALDSRRAAINEINTPGRNRRRSVRDQRETPRDLLRALSRTLAPKSNVITTSSSSSPDDPNNSGTRKRSGRSRSRGRRGGPVTIPEDPDDSDEFPIDKPRLSLPIDDVSDDDLRPPRTSGLEDLEDNFTMQSIELARRQTLDNQRYSMRMSDYGPMNDPPSDEDVGIDSAFFPRTNWDDDVGDDSGMAGLGDDDATFERIDDDEAGRRETLGRESFGAIDVNFDEADQSTVMLQPQVESSPRRESFSSPRNEPFAMEDDPMPEDMDVDDNDNAPLDLGGEGEGDDDIDLGDLASEAATAAAVERTTKQAVSKRLKKPGKKVSQHGIEYPSLPPAVVKRVAQRFAGKTKISPDTLAALMQASDWFFEQLGDDLSAYAKHAGRKTIEESDMLTLMRRQRQINATTTPFALAQRHLPRELLQELRMPPPGRVKTKKRRRTPSVGEDGGVT
ncbi:hypothetical protein N8I77_010244 [Diaporthe amygdali]|uniref:CENP-T/Histone H4 histone fold domain-containing protein n=1 Tax=Phomopsis amygdali TaxID=1214568 RepID=A0AAD9VZ70_PHOAM|nr:hypothetical protein N8I77_010244 [Diaporthe amygdali]